MARVTKPKKPLRTGPPEGQKFKKGQSGNPGGVPKWVKLVRGELEACSTGGVSRLRQLIEQGVLVYETKQGPPIYKEADAKDIIKAIELVLSYTLAKPKAELEVTGKDGGPLRTKAEVELTEEQVLELWKAHAKAAK
jgi:hypothetical protein